MTARGPARPPTAPPARRVRGAAGEQAGTCLACGRRYGLDDMIGLARHHMHAAPGAGSGGAYRLALLLFTGGRLAAGGAWFLVQIWDRATLTDLAGFVVCEWFRRRVGVRAAIAGTATGSARALPDTTAHVADLFTKAAELELETDTEYKFLIECVGEALRATGSTASVLAESPVVPGISFKAMDGRGPHATPTILTTPARGEGAEPGDSPGRAPVRPVPAPAWPGGGPFHAGPRPSARPAPPYGGRSP